MARIAEAHKDVKLKKITKKHDIVTSCSFALFKGFMKLSVHINGLAVPGRSLSLRAQIAV